MRQAGSDRTLNAHRAPASRALVVATMMLGTVSTILSATIVNVAFPALIAEFHVGHDTLQWIAAGYLAAMTATMLGTAWLVAVDASERFQIPIELTRDFYLEYRMTETNVAFALRNGVSEEEIRAWCSRTLDPVWGDQPREVLFSGYFACLARS